MAVMCALTAMGADSRAKSFNADWRFCLGDNKEAQNASYDDSQWRTLNLPHDWAIEGEFSIDNPSGTGGGALPGGIGWYRKTFECAPQPGERVYVDFDGSYMNTTVYINGHELGLRPYGYASFSYDITDYLHADKPNVMAVKVDNALQPNSRWYSGCGIYRNVWLRKVNNLNIPLWGQFIRFDASDARAKATVTTEVANQGKKAVKADAEITLFDADGKAVASATKKGLKVTPKGTEFTASFTVDKPHLWSNTDPYLYTCVTKLKDAKTGKVIDEYSQKVGIRYFEFTADKGFFLNGKNMKINGVCLHHDAGALGAVVNKDAIIRQVNLMRDMGANAIRTSHNPPAPELLDVCDSLGVLVMDETFDMWRRKKTKYDYSLYFDKWAATDMTDLYRRDRNHPSIIIWSIGNEVLEQWDDASADTLSLAEANLILNFGHAASKAKDNGEQTVNSLLTSKLVALSKELDPTRPVTSGCNEPAPHNHLLRSNALDIIGYNYHENWFDSVPKLFPGKPFIVTESVSALMTRGYYKMPSDSMNIWPVRWDIPFYDSTFSCSSYDNCHAPWGSTHEDMMRIVNNSDHISGQFVWTGQDYIGEPTPFGWPARSSFFGIVDLAGFPKDVYYMYQSEWQDQDMLQLFPHWNWTPGKTIDMWAYYNNADDVELIVNGVSQGRSSKTDDRLHAFWRVEYQPGEVVAISRKNGEVVCTHRIRTAGQPHHIELIPDSPGSGSLKYVQALVVDEYGNTCPWATDMLTVTPIGDTTILGVDAGNPLCLDSFKSNQVKAHYGKALIILKGDGDASIEVSAPGLVSAKL